MVRGPLALYPCCACVVSRHPSLGFVRHPRVFLCVQLGEEWADRPDEWPGYDEDRVTGRADCFGPARLMEPDSHFVVLAVRKDGIIVCAYPATVCAYPATLRRASCCALPVTGACPVGEPHAAAACVGETVRDGALVRCDHDRCACVWAARARVRRRLADIC